MKKLNNKLNNLIEININMNILEFYKIYEKYLFSLVIKEMQIKMRYFKYEINK